jgi:hypothetical protein
MKLLLAFLQKLEDPTVIFRKFGGYVELIAKYGV